MHLTESFGVVPVRAAKVKVAPGGTPSNSRRIQIEPEPHTVPSLEQVANEREYGQFLIDWRVADISAHMNADLRSLILNRYSKVD